MSESVRGSRNLLENNFLIHMIKGLISWIISSQFLELVTLLESLDTRALRFTLPPQHLHPT